MISSRILTKVELNSAEAFDQTQLNNSLIHYAQHGCVDSCRVLIEKGADVNAINDMNQTPLMVASIFLPENAPIECDAYIMVIDLLLQQKNSLDNLTKSLLCAIRALNHFRTDVAVRKLISAGADVNVTDKVGQSCLALVIHDYMFFKFECYKVLSKHLIGLGATATVNRNGGVKYNYYEFYVDRTLEIFEELKVEIQRENAEATSRLSPLRLEPTSRFFGVPKDIIDYYLIPMSVFYDSPFATGNKRTHIEAVDEDATLSAHKRVA